MWEPRIPGCVERLTSFCCSFAGCILLFAVEFTKAPLLYLARVPLKSLTGSRPRFTFQTCQSSIAFFFRPGTHITACQSVTQTRWRLWQQSRDAHVWASGQSQINHGALLHICGLGTSWWSPSGACSMRSILFTATLPLVCAHSRCQTALALNLRGCLFFFFFALCTCSYSSWITLALRYWEWIRCNGGNINLRLTPSVKVISQPSPTLALCHVMRFALSLSPAFLSLPRSRPPCLPNEGYLARLQPHSSNGANEIEEDSCWCSQFVGSGIHTHTDNVYNTEAGV